jgi:hypothetical protein
VKPALNQSVFKDRTFPPGKEAPGRFQGVVHAIHTVSNANQVTWAKQTRQIGVYGPKATWFLIE